MGYYVLGDQGQKYGPADVATLNMWISEGRLVAHSMLEDEASGAKVAASMVPGLQFPLSPPPTATYAPPPAAPSAGASPYPPSGPYASPPAPGQANFGYQRINQIGDGGQKDFQMSLVLAAVSVLLTLFLPIGGLICSGYAFRSAKRAQVMGHPSGTIAMVVSGVAIGLWIVTRIIGFRAHF